MIDGCIPGRPGRPLPFPKPHPKPWDDASLNNLFTGSAPKQKGSEAAPVSVGDWTVEARSALAVATPRTLGFPGKSRVPAPGFRNVNCGDKDGCKSDLGKGVEDFVDAVTKPIEKYVDRDRTQESRDTYGGCRMKGTCPK